MNLNSIEKDVITNYREGKIPLFEDQNEEISLTRF